MGRARNPTRNVVVVNVVVNVAVVVAGHSSFRG